MRITTARYYTPSGRSIQAKGIEPDVRVKQAKLEEIESTAYNLSEADLKGALKNEQANDNGKNKKDDEKKAADKRDYQLVRALDLVKALYIYGQNDNNLVNSEKKAKEETKEEAKAEGQN